jgi:transmembrane sensor
VAEPPSGLARRGRRDAGARVPRRAMWAAAAAASVALLVGGGVWNLERTAPKLLAYETPVGAERTVTLEDGSVVQLNTASRLEVLYHGDRRDLRLARGEAYFEVAPNPRRPFIVYAGPGAVRAVGTAFAVRVQPNGLNVTLTKGAVELSAVQSARRGAVDLADAHTLARHAVAHMVAAPGSAESAVIAQGQVQVRELSASETARRLSWRQGTLVFEGERLQDVVDEVSRYTLVKIAIPDPELRSLRIAGYFNAGDVEPMFEALQAGFGVRVERIDAKHVRLERAAVRTEGARVDTPRPRAH